MRARRAPARPNDLLVGVLLAATCPVLLVPAMNDRMWAHPQTQRERRASPRARLHACSIPTTARSRRAREAARGACRSRRPSSRMSARLLESAIGFAGRACRHRRADARGRSIRCAFISNHSSGQDGRRARRGRVASRREVDARRRPARASPLPAGVHGACASSRPKRWRARSNGCCRQSRRARDGRRAGRFSRRRHVASAKIKKANAPPTLELAPTPDILQSTSARTCARARCVVGFALETERRHGQRAAEARVESPRHDRVNDAREPGAGFGVDTNRVTFICARRTARRTSRSCSRREVADAILDRVSYVAADSVDARGSAAPLPRAAARDGRDGARARRAHRRGSA